MDLGFAERIALLGDASQRGGVFLASGTVHDDGDPDVLTGSAGQDWFLFNQDGGVKDMVTDMSTFEAMYAEDIDFIASS